MLGIYEIADRILEGCYRTYGKDWGKDLLRSDFDRLCVVMGIAKDKRIFDKYWNIFRDVGWITARSGRVAHFNLEAYQEHKRLFEQVNNNGRGRK